MKRVMTLNQKQIRNPAGEDTFSLAPDEAGTVTGGRTYRLDSSEKTKIPYDSTRWARKPLRPFSAYTLEPLFLHILKAAVSPVIAKPVQGSQLKFSYARNVSCYKLVIHHSRGDGTARPAPSVASTRTDWEGAVLQAEEIPLSLKCSRCGQIFSPARQKRFSAPCPFCGEEQGHSIGAGRELYIQSMEAE